MHNELARAESACDQHEAELMRLFAKDKKILPAALQYTMACHPFNPIVSNVLAYGIARIQQKMLRATLMEEEENEPD